MDLHGLNIIAGDTSGTGAPFTGINASTGDRTRPEFHEATSAEIDTALRAASEAFEVYRTISPDKIAGFLDAIADGIMALGDELIRKANEETALPEARLTGERGRTVGQLRMFAELIREGSWVEARIDRAMPDRKPLPRPDLRRMLMPIGPVVVFGASNFPLAFSVAGGDTASAFAAGNPVVAKAHPAHPGTSEMVGRAITQVVRSSGMPAGVFSMLHGAGHKVGRQLVEHPLTKTVAFTGSLKGGRALFDAAARRPEPIAVFAEMGSTNPVFVLPGALAQRSDAIAEGFVQSVTLGVGQFCTNPGIMVGMREAGLDALASKTSSLIAGVASGTMLFSALCDRFGEGVAKLKATAGVSVVGQANRESGKAAAVVFQTDARTYLRESLLQEELFGPSSVVVGCKSRDELEEVARNMPGQLTATIQGTEDDLREFAQLVSILQQKVGRILFNGFPTGVEVSPAMQHGGPYPATTDPRWTSVGTAAIKRFVRPICFQGFPDAALPLELQNANPRGIWRLMDNKFTKDPV